MGGVCTVGILCGVQSVMAVEGPLKHAVIAQGG